MRVNRARFADIVGKSLNTVTNWLSEGMPYVESPGGGHREWVLDSGECIGWLISRAKDDKHAGGGNTTGDAKTRRMLAEAALKELQLREKQGDLISVDDATNLAAESFAVVKSRLRAIPRNLAQELSKEQRDILTREINTALKHLSGGDE